jgi:hypothetical protein
MKFPGNARLELTLYFKSPSLGKIMFIDVDASPDDDGEVERLSEGIAELSRRWCVALNRRRKVGDFRPATRAEAVAYIQRQDGVNQQRTAAKPVRRSASAASVATTAWAGRVRYGLRELSSRYLAMRQRALSALRSRPRSRSLEWWQALPRQ